MSARRGEPPSWDDLRIALTIARMGSLSRAASKLGINQSTVGRRLSSLESALDATLFRRSRKGLMPTEAGEMLIARACEIERQMRDIVDAIDAATTGPSGTVRLIGNQWMLDRLLDHGLAAFMLERHALSLRITTGRPRTSLWQGDPGVALWFEQEPIGGAFAVQIAHVPYATYRSRCGCPPGWIMFYDEDRTDSKLGQFTKTMSDDIPVRMTATDAGTLRSAIAAGLGHGYLPVCLGDEDPRLMRVEEIEPFERPLYLHMHPDSLGSLCVQHLMPWLRSNVQRVLVDPVDWTSIPANSQELLA